MNQFAKTFSLSACALAASLLISACGGGTVTDTTPPTVAITSASGTGGTATFTFTFNEELAANTFVIEDILVTGGTAASLTQVDATHFTLTVTPTGSAVTVSVAANKFDDLAHNFNTVAASSTLTTSSGNGTGTALVSFDEATAPTLTGFGGAEDATVVVDPAGGTNKVAKVVKSATAELWAGTTVSTGANESIATIPFSTTATTMTVRVYAPAAGIPVRLKVETAGDPTRSVETEATTTVAGGWQTLTFNFANQAAGTAALNLAFTYNKASIFFNFGTTGADGGGGTFFFDDVTFVAGTTGGTGTGTGTALVSFDEATAPTLTGFGGAEDATVVVDPAGGTNKVAKVVKSATAELWAGTTVSTGANESIATIPFSATATTMTVRVYAPAAGIPVRLKVETAGDPTRSVETEATTTVAGGWQTLTFNFANQAAGTAALNLAFTYNKASIFFNFGTTGADGGGGTFFFDDVNFLP